MTMNLRSGDNASEVMIASADSQVAQSRFREAQISLSKRESEILSYLSNGYTTPSISKLLYISQDTVETHRKNIMRKLRATNIVAAVAYALRHRLID
jgi:DNA-binding CsgD family transcriptional regulator